MKLYRDDDGKLSSYAWPGGYQIVYYTRDNELLCPDCANKAEEEETEDPVVSSEIFYEGAAEQCADCGRLIESAYGDPEQEEA